MKTRLLLIDNYDSFTFNLAQAFQVLGAEVIVRRNDKIELDEAEAMNPTHLVISPGPGRPEQAGVSMAMIARFMERIPVLGVCLGHQAISLVFGGEVGPSKSLMHGKESAVYHDESVLYAGLPNPFQAGRYHSLSVPSFGLPADFSVASHTSDGEIMGFHHQTLPVLGVQFHPESILTPQGDQLLRNFLEMSPLGQST
ncbi:MAG: anthranilate/aminodeoxychorismate synthase component II [Deltaproteobacteria bacterium]|nr:anthranilate/aminodeoxychorismate synthase component II [Deltaproteobacteria bacterium]